MREPGGDLFPSGATYTKALLSAVPEVGGDAGGRILLQGDIPSPIHLPTGCRFHTRCPRATERCETEVPPVLDIGAGNLCAVITGRAET
jgi:oligopeptide/dipeptide ABC transporter ATP-binding protein